MPEDYGLGGGCASVYQCSSEVPKCLLSLHGANAVQLAVNGESGNMFSVRLLPGFPHTWQVVRQPEQVVNRKAPIGLDDGGSDLCVRLLDSAGLPATLVDHHTLEKHPTRTYDLISVGTKKQRVPLCLPSITIKPLQFDDMCLMQYPKDNDGRSLQLAWSACLHDSTLTLQAKTDQVPLTREHWSAHTNRVLCHAVLDLHQVVPEHLAQAPQMLDSNLDALPHADTAPLDIILVPSETPTSVHVCASNLPGVSVVRSVDPGNMQPNPASVWNIECSAGASLQGVYPMGTA